MMCVLYVYMWKTIVDGYAKCIRTKKFENRHEELEDQFFFNQRLNVEVDLRFIYLNNLL